MAFTHLTRAVRPALRAAPIARAAPRMPCTAANRLYSSHHGHGHEEEYNEPGGHLWNLAPGEERPREDWEFLYKYGYLGGMALFFLAYWFKPDTRMTTWAEEEALRRLQNSDIKWWYEPSPNSAYYGNPAYYPPGVEVPKKEK